VIDNPYIGKPLRRKEDPRLLCGQGQYVADLARPGAVHLAFVRSAHAHARITRVGIARARALSGVAGAFVHADLGVGAIRAEYTGPNYHGVGWPVLADGVTRYVGEPIAAVAAGDRYTAEDAVDLIDVDYHPLDVIASVEAARREGAALVHGGVPANRFFRREHRHGDVDAAFAQAPVRVHGRFRHQRVSGSPMEGRAITAEWDARGRLTVWLSTQVPHLARTGLARCLRVGESEIRVIAPDVGGGFGPKMHLYPEDVAACAVARLLGRPVTWIEDRRESLLAMSHAREQTIDASLAADRDGRIVALCAAVVCDSGAYPVFPVASVLEPMGTAQIMPGPYRVPAYAYVTESMATNKCPIGAYRGVGMAVGVFVMERLIDKLAAAVGADSAEVRRRNFVAPDAFPYTAPSGLVYDSGRFADTLASTLARFDYAAARVAQAQARRDGRLIGIGLSTFTEYTGMGPKTFARRGMVDVPGYEAATVKVDPSGQARVYTSCPSQGQGLETVYAQLVAGELGLDPAAVHVAPVDTDSAPRGSGTFGSRAVVVGGGALIRAAAQVRAKASAIAAHLLEAAMDDLVLADGRCHVRGAPERAVGWEAIAHAAYAPTVAGLPDGFEAGLEASSTYEPDGASTFSNGAHAAMVEVDAGTGEVHILKYVIGEDCGPILNPLMVEGQTQGGLAQGIGEALLEEVVHDDTGQVLSATLMDYLLPTAAEVPNVEIVHVETPSPITERGFKGMGESAVIGSPACIANAVSDALGVAVDALPITPTRVLELIRPGRAAGPSLNVPRPKTVPRSTRRRAHPDEEEQ
jgi:carbon-monoxide dehydrogenase large subunit